MQMNDLEEIIEVVYNMSVLFFSPANTLCNQNYLPNTTMPTIRVPTTPE